MKHLLWTLLAVGVALSFGCDDDVDPGADDVDGAAQDVGPDGAGGAGGNAVIDAGDPDLGGGGDEDMGLEPDGAVLPPDAGDPDIGVTPDMAAPDMATPDAAPPPEADAGAMCVPGDDCGEHHACHGDACRWDLRPAVFRLTDALVVEPAPAAPELTAALTLAVQTNALNILFEPGYYGDNGYAFYVGNGSSIPGPGFRFRHDLPIPRFDGTWRETDDGVRWQQDEEGVWVLQIPERTVQVPVDPMDPEGEMQDATCWIAFPSTIRMEFWPDTDDEGNELLRGRAVGSLNDADIDRISVQGIEFRDFFENEPPDLDLDGDGVNDAYTFELEATAARVEFSDEPPADDDSNRVADPGFENPAECNQ